MGIYDEGIEVSLTADLTRYHPSLRRGARGKTVPPVGEWARGSDRFCSVQFAETTIDVLWSSLAVVDERALKLAADERSRRERAIREGFIAAYKVIGPNGGFKYFSVDYIDENKIKHGFGTAFRTEGLYLEKLVLEAGHPVPVKRLDRGNSEGW